MSDNKHAIIRYHALDKCFRNKGKRYAMDDLVLACQEALYEFSGVEEGVKRRQVYDDITFMQSDQGWSILLDKIRDGRKVYYQYKDKDFSIKNEPLNESEANQLKTALLTLNRFKGMPQFEWVEEMTARLESSFDLVGSEQQVIEFEQNPYVQGLDHISDCYYAIIYHKVLEISYQSFKQDNASIFAFHPHYLKQYNSRWYLLGITDGYTTLTNLALDRIKSIKEIDKEYQASKIDFFDHFEDVVGVSVDINNPSEIIELQIDADLWPFIKTRPLHGSQKVIEENENYVILNLDLRPNHELESLILRYGEQIKVLQPKALVQKISERLNSASNKYK